MNLIWLITMSFLATVSSAADEGVQKTKPAEVAVGILTSVRTGRVMPLFTLKGKQFSPARVFRHGQMEDGSATPDLRQKFAECTHSSGHYSCKNNQGSVAKFGFSSKIEKLGTINSMTYGILNSSKTNFATEPNLRIN